MGKKRNDVPLNYQWRLQDIFEDENGWNLAFSEAEALCEELSSLEYTISTSADALYYALKTESKASLMIEQLYSYAFMHRDEDNGNPHYQGMTDRAMQLIIKLQSGTAWLSPEILSLDEDLLMEWMSEDRFSVFRFGITDLIRRNQYILSKQEERLLALANDPLSGIENAFSMLNDVDLNFGTITDSQGNEISVTHASYGSFIEDPDRCVRRDAYQALYRAYRSVNNTISALYAASVKNDVFQAKARGYHSSLECALFDGNVPTSVYYELIDGIHAALPSLHKYLDLRKNALKLERLEMYDLYTPIVADCAESVPYSKACILVKEATAPLGDEYIHFLEQAFQENWIDIYENEGKTSGAYSCGVYGVHPYVLLNYRDTLDGAFTLAHELGHAMHSLYSNRSQPYELSSYKIMVAEVASTVNESLLISYLLNKETDRTKRAWLLNHFLEQIRTTCFRQTMFAEFEMKAHEMAERGEPLTPKSLSQLYKTLNETYYRGVNVDENIIWEWLRIPHFYRAFYVYQYATGICAAVKISCDILKNGCCESYLKFLSSGGSDYPIHQLQEAGVDLTDGSYIREAMALFSERVNELAELLQLV